MSPMTLKAQPSNFTGTQRKAFAVLERAISNYRIAATDEHKDAVWAAALLCTCHHLLFVITPYEREIIRLCVPPRVLLTRPLTEEEKNHE